jgi:hypothetical protein
MPRKNKRLEEALARVDAAIAEAVGDREELLQKFNSARERVWALEKVRTFLVFGGQTHE